MNFRFDLQYQHFYPLISSYFIFCVVIKIGIFWQFVDFVLYIFITLLIIAIFTLKIFFVNKVNSQILGFLDQSATILFFISLNLKKREWCFCPIYLFQQPEWQWSSMKNANGFVVQILHVRSRWRAHEPWTIWNNH